MTNIEIAAIADQVAALRASGSSPSAFDALGVTSQGFVTNLGHVVGADLEIRDRASRIAALEIAP